MGGISDWGWLSYFNRGICLWEGDNWAGCWITRRNQPWQYWGKPREEMKAVLETEASWAWWADESRPAWWERGEQWGEQGRQGQWWQGLHHAGDGSWRHSEFTLNAWGIQRVLSRRVIWSEFSSWIQIIYIMLLVQDLVLGSYLIHCLPFLGSTTDHYRLPEGGWPTYVYLPARDGCTWLGKGTTPDPSDFLPTAYHPPPRQMPTTSARPRGSQGRITGPPAGSSSRPLSRLHVVLKMRSIPAILITGCCISQQPVHTKEKQTKNDFSTCLWPLPSFLPEISLQSLAPRPWKALQVCAISLRVCWCDIKMFFSSKYLRERQFQLPSSGLESYWSYSS